MSYNLFLDDIRDPNVFLKSIKTWVIARDYQEFINIIKERGLPEFVSFDHDLAFEHYPFNDDSPCDEIIPYNDYKEKTGYHCAQFLINYCIENDKDFPNYKCHSMNVIGKQNIISLIESYKKSRLL